MIVKVNSRAFGVLDSQREQKEFMLILAAIDCAVRNKSAWIADVMTWFLPEYITDPYHRAIFQRVLQMQEAGAPVVPYVLAKCLQGCGEPYGKVIRDTANLLLDCTSQGGHIAYYAKDVFQEYRRRSAAVEIEDAADEMAITDDPDNVLDRLPAIASKYAPRPENRTTDNALVMQNIIAELEGTTRDDYFHFGIASLDRMVGGVSPTALVTVGARTSNGKSVFLGQSAIKCADRDHKPVLFFSLEMSQGDMYKRWASVLSRQPIKGGNQREFLGGLSRVDKLLRDGLIHVFAGPRTAEQITSDALAYATRCELGLIVIDYIQAVVPTKSRSDGREQQVAHVAACLKHLASKAGVPVLTASQLNKAGEDSPRLSSIRESEAIGNYSNIVLMLNPTPGSALVVDVEINIAKNRDGAKDLATAIWEKPIFTMRDIEAEDAPNYDPALANVTESTLPGVIDASRRNQPNWQEWQG